MKKKQTYILLIIVLVIWGLVFYQFFSYSEPNEITIEDISTKEISYKLPDTFSIDVNYRDPFSGEDYFFEEETEYEEENIEPIPNNTIIEKPVIQEVKPEELINVVYKGLVSDLPNKKKVFMININNKSYIMQPGDIENDVKLLSGNPKSITIKLKGIKKNIPIIE